MRPWNNSKHVQMLITVGFLTTSLLWAQTKNKTETQFVPAGETKSSNVDVAQRAEEDIYFTGKLMGYYRLPDRQDYGRVAASDPCPDPHSKGNAPSRDAAVFFDKYEKRAQDTILVGTGDNFAPNYYSRVLENIGTQIPIHLKKNYMTGTPSPMLGPGTKTHPQT
jgi:hypothetical protein